MRSVLTFVSDNIFKQIKHIINFVISFGLTTVVIPSCKTTGLKYINLQLLQTLQIKQKATPRKERN